jgi:outer membrane protein
MLYRSMHRLCRARAPVENLAHSASFRSLDEIAPSNPGIKHLMPFPRSQTVTPRPRSARDALTFALSVSCALANLWLLTPREATAEMIGDALAKAYVNNADLDEQRANVRVRDEDVPKAATGMRPRASLSVNGGPGRTAVRQPAGFDQLNNRLYSDDKYSGLPKNGTLGVQQPLFDGGKTENSVRQAESGVFAARYGLRQSEQETLQKAATAYMNVLRDTAVLALRKRNILVLVEQLRVTRDRQHFGEVTMTDVAQAEAALAQAHSDYAGAQSSLENSIADYCQVIGEGPKRLEPAKSLEPMLPKSREDAITIALVEHPSVVAALYQVDAAEAAAKVAESALMPTVSVGGQLMQQYDSYLNYPGTKQYSLTLSGQLNVPLYQGGGEYSGIRQAKEQLGQARIHASVQRNAVRTAVVQAYSLLNAAKAAVTFNQIAVKSAETALRGVRDEAAFGQRTTLDVLNAQQALLKARVDLVTAQRDRVVGSYAVLAAIGRLSSQTVDLDVATYDPSVHFEQVKNKWIGTDTPDGN